MNHGNVCKDIDVKKIITSNPIEHMMELQRLLQERLGKGHDNSDSFELIATKLIYWRHCIHTECDELLEWFDTPEPDHQELEMEIVDIMHFVFNMAIATGISSANINSAVKPYLARHDEYALAAKIGYTEKLICTLSNAITEYINLFPWKSWKTYDPEAIPELNDVITRYAQIVIALFEIAAFYGMTLERIVSVYCAKNAENHRRQDDGY